MLACMAISVVLFLLLTIGLFNSYSEGYYNMYNLYRYYEKESSCYIESGQYLYAVFFLINSVHFLSLFGILCVYAKLFVYMFSMVYLQHPCTLSLNMQFVELAWWYSCIQDFLFWTETSFLPAHGKKLVSICWTEVVIMSSYFYWL